MTASVLPFPCGNCPVDLTLSRRGVQRSFLGTQYTFRFGFRSIFPVRDTLFVSQGVRVLWFPVSTLRYSPKRYAVLLSTVSDPLFDTQCTFRPPHRRFRLSRGGFDPPSEVLDLPNRFQPSLSRGIHCLTLPLFQPFISVVLSKTQTPLFTFPVLSLYSLACRPLGCFTLTPPAYKSAGGCEV